MRGDAHMMDMYIARLKGLDQGSAKIVNYNTRYNPSMPNRTGPGDDSSESDAELS